MPQRHTRIASLLLVAATATGSTTAFAQSAAANASIANLNFQLTDLDLNDGITPAMTITRTQTMTQSYYGTVYAQIDDQTIHTPGSTSVATPFGQASGSGGAAPWSSAARYADPAPPSVYLKSYNFYQISFTLTPSTGLFVTADASLDASDAGGISEAFARTHLAGWLNAELLYNFIIDGANAYDTSLTQTLAGQMHSGTDAVTGGIYLVTEAVAQLAPVPEPGSVAMLLAGLAVVGAGVRRRRTGA